MSDDLDRKILGYSLLSSREQDRFRSTALLRARRLKGEATTSFFRSLMRGAGFVLDKLRYGKERARTSETSIPGP